MYSNIHKNSDTQKTLPSYPKIWRKCGFHKEQGVQNMQTEWQTV